MRMAIDWENLTFKGKDVIITVIVVSGFVFNYASNNEKLNTIIDNQTANKELFKEYGVRLSILEMDQKLLKQQFETFQNNAGKIR